MSERPTMSDGSPFDPTDSVHVAERLSVVATERDRLAARLAEVEGQARLSNARAMELEAERDEARRRLAEVEAERDRLEDTLDRAESWTEWRACWWDGLPASDWRRDREFIEGVHLLTEETKGGAFIEQRTVWASRPVRVEEQGEG